MHHNLAGVYHSMGNLNKARQHSETAKAMLDNMYGGALPSDEVAKVGNHIYYFGMIVTVDWLKPFSLTWYYKFSCLLHYIGLKNDVYDLFTYPAGYV